VTSDDRTRLERLAAEVEDLRIAQRQLHDVVARLGGTPLPPKQLQVRVVGRYGDDFVSSGDHIADDLNRVLAPHKVSLQSFSSILDFGCGCGRVLGAVATRLRPHQHLFGCDIDSEAVNWFQAHCAHIAEVEQCPHLPRSLYHDAQFELVYGISVLTHLPEAMQFDWLRELARITAPGGYVVLSVHGKNHLHHFPVDARKEIERRGFAYSDLGQTDGLPDFYLSTYHAEAYIREWWSEFMDVLDVVELGIHSVQDAVVCRVRTS
jgi:SAM-dependent methyltransferase